MFSKILVPIDGSAESIAALKQARKIAEQFNSSVTLIHIIQLSTYAHSIPDAIIQSLDEGGKQIIIKALEIFKDYNGRVTTEIEYGHPGIKITEYSKENNFSLIIMGRSGMSDVAKLLIGSVSNYVLHYAHCPTLIIRNAD
ncbi:universal stress protein [Dendrosporobacter sp. 1207_IL3150]|uniref:universal stress protein n=1 Tax=Dendrosporobacter sp. 1207_IL3150 TaxID=3084054 RepID=UPI002FDA07AB